VSAREFSFDGLVGPTHNYAGLSWGNVASMGHGGADSNPRAAALQGLAKMQVLHGLGIPQGVLPPHERPHLPTLRRLGFTGDDAAVIERAAREAPAVFSACCSASAMWTANACTVSPGADTADGRVHFTPANLSSKFHRGIEAPTTARVLSAIFASPAHFAHHPHLPAGEHFADEGAANHTRLCAAYGEPGVELFVHGRAAFDTTAPSPTRFPARQTREASEAVARLHRLDPDRVLHVQQNPAVVDAGVFHNDVIAVGNGNLLLYHEHAFVDGPAVIAALRSRLGETPLVAVMVQDAELNLADAVSSYLFNSQIVTVPDGDMALIAPVECAEHAAARACIDRLLEDDSNPLRQVHFPDVRESMRNGGGPACLRQRVVLDDAQAREMNAGVRYGPELHHRLTDWVQRHYRDRLAPADLGDPQLLDECRRALDELSGILDLGSVHDFQLP
jgi:succinylarginine dihydrolase